ncbi:hypothetical protein CASFOL_017308 [Castilleja foliolosa]|uniref:Homeobox domain-containing protein n=1 Tax=Castilleja foliolosa TaxID=1961234 RepID=A0ABD3DEQ1_9LAMI
MMWMMGYNDAGEFNTIQDPFTGRKLRPLMSRPVAAVPATNHPACFTRIHGVDHFLGLHHHHHGMVEQNKRELTTQQVVVSSRWNPTPEQLQTLEELYRRGTRTPTAEQIQQITSQLRRYGKIEGKNVFYWFQNHKARERQKRRRQLNDDQQQQPNNNNNNINQNEKEEKSEPPEHAGSSNRTALIEVEETRNWASNTNSSTIAEKTTQGASKGAELQAECKADGWLHFEDDDILLQQRRNATWHMMHLSSSSSSPINNSSSIVVSTTRKQPDDDHFVNNHLGDKAQTLELFPLQSGRGLNDDEECGPTSDDHVMTSAPYQFFEFLPIKN